jgi:hypothetical protein
VRACSVAARLAVAGPRRSSGCLQDPTLREFLSDAPSAIAGLRIQHAFELRYTREQCREIIESYATQGGDNGLTEDAVRKASGLVLRRPQSPFPSVPDTHRMLRSLLLLSLSLPLHLQPPPPPPSTGHAQAVHRVAGSVCMRSGA